MTATHSPEPPGAIRVRLAYLKGRKAVLDELIASLERYSRRRIVCTGKKPGMQQTAENRSLAGTA